MWTSSCINLSYNWSCLHHRLCNMHTIRCLHSVVVNLEGNFKNGKICYGVIQLNRLIQQANLHSSSEPYCYHFLPLTIQNMPLWQNLFGWFTYKGFLTANFWNNRIVRVESAAGKTVHKLFVGGVWLKKYHLFQIMYENFKTTLLLHVFPKWKVTWAKLCIL